MNAAREAVTAQPAAIALAIALGYVMALMVTSVPANAHVEPNEYLHSAQADATHSAGNAYVMSCGSSQWPTLLVSHQGYDNSTHTMNLQLRNASTGNWTTLTTNFGQSRIREWTPMAGRSVSGMISYVQPIHTIDLIYPRFQHAAWTYCS